MLKGLASFEMLCMPIDHFRVHHQGAEVQCLSHAPWEDVSCHRISTAR
jgi:hypothetical protein